VDPLGLDLSVTYRCSMLDHEHREGDHCTTGQGRAELLSGVSVPRPHAQNETCCSDDDEDAPLPSP
jgi:hypothetical protein